jgi:hypothetical protein
LAESPESDLSERDTGMKMSVQHALVYKDYLIPIRALEKSFKAAGLNIEFELTVSEYGNKGVVIYEGIRPPHIISIEGDSPAMAVKHIALAVRL